MPDEFAATQPGYATRYLPTTKDHLFLRMEIPLPSGRLLLVRRPPALYEGVVSANRGLVTFLLDEAAEARVNGRYMAGSRIATQKEGTSYRGHDESSPTVCSLLVSDSSAFTSVLGISPNRYLLLHRLWSTRKALLQADDQGLVKSIALDHGFWHLGRFSRIYQSTFGELPSATLASRGLAPFERRPSSAWPALPAG